MTVCLLTAYVQVTHLGDVSVSVKMQTPPAVIPKDVVH